MQSESMLQVHPFDAPGFKYPKCCHDSKAECRFYARLRNIYETHGHTWDKESKYAWFSLIEKPAFKSTLTRGVVSHRVSRALTAENLTWAHVVYLKEIFGESFFQSPKTMGMVSEKYPSAQFDTYYFKKSYEISSSDEQEEEAVIAQRDTPLPASVLDFGSAAQTSDQSQPMGFPDFLKRRNVFSSTAQALGASIPVGYSNGLGGTEKSPCLIRDSVEHAASAPVGFLNGLKPSEQPIVDSHLRPELASHLSPRNAPRLGRFNLNAGPSSTPRLLEQYEYVPTMPALKRPKLEHDSASWFARSPTMVERDSANGLAEQVRVLKGKVESLEQERITQREEFQRHGHETRLAMRRLECYISGTKAFEAYHRGSHAY